MTQRCKFNTKSRLSPNESETELSQTKNSGLRVLRAPGLEPLLGIYTYTTTGIYDYSGERQRVKVNPYTEGPFPETNN